MSLIDIELLRVGGPEHVNEFLVTKRQLIANALSAMVAYLNNSDAHATSLPPAPYQSVAPSCDIRVPPCTSSKLWIETRATEELYNKMLAFLMISLDVGRGEILLQERGRIVEHRGVYEMMQETGGIAWDNAVPARSLADIIEDIYEGDFMRRLRTTFRGVDIFLIISTIM